MRAPLVSRLSALWLAVTRLTCFWWLRNGDNDIPPRDFPVPAVVLASDSLDPWYGLGDGWSAWFVQRVALFVRTQESFVGSVSE